MDKKTYLNKYILINEEGSNIRIDKYLASSLNIKRSLITFNIEKENVLVNAKPTKASYKLRKNDGILIKEIENPERTELKGEEIPLDIVYEDDDIIVINKPRGLVVHPGIGNKEHTLVNALIGAKKELANNSSRPGIVHRLDKDTSGLMLVAKNDESLSFLSSLLKDHKIKRHYIALVKGNISENEGTIIAPLAKDKKHPLRRAVNVNEGKEAVTFFTVKKRYGNYTLVDIELQTGRTHQIRVHFDYIGHPVIGDKLYGKQNATLTSDGQLLHAYKIELIHPKTKKELHFEVPLPNYFVEILSKL